MVTGALSTPLHSLWFAGTNERQIWFGRKPRQITPVEPVPGISNISSRDGSRGTKSKPCLSAIVIERCNNGTRGFQRFTSPASCRGPRDRPVRAVVVATKVLANTNAKGKLTERGGDPATKRVLGTTERLEPRRREPPPREGGRARYREREGGKPRAETRGRAAQSETDCAQSQIRKPGDDINYILSTDGNESSAAHRNITRLRRTRLKSIRRVSFRKLDRSSAATRIFAAHRPYLSIESDPLSICDALPR